MRANDGAIDSQGRFWVSAFNDPSITKLEPVGMALPIMFIYLATSSYSKFTVLTVVQVSSSD